MQPIVISPMSDGKVLRTVRQAVGLRLRTPTPAWLAAAQARRDVGSVSLLHHYYQIAKYSLSVSLYCRAFQNAK